jgi:hypothetical protein
MDKIFPLDKLAKRERVERTLNFLPVDRAVLHEQLSFNASVIAEVTGRRVSDYNYTYEDICAAIHLTLDACFPPVAPRGSERFTDEDGFVVQNDEWNEAFVSRPFNDVAGAREYLKWKTHHLLHNPFDDEKERQRYQAEMHRLQTLIGETVIIDYPVEVGFCTCWSRLGLDLFSYLYAEDPQTISDYLEAATIANIRRLHAIADPAISPVVLIAEDFASKGGPIFSPAMLSKEHFPRVKRLTDAWHSHGMKVIYHSDGNWKRVIPDLAACGVDGFYCLEPSLGMEIVELKRSWPNYTWAGGVDGVDLMERGTPQQVHSEVRRQILETNALHKGGIFIDTSSEINPPIKPENYRAMIEAVGELINPDFS